MSTSGTTRSTVADHSPGGPSSQHEARSTRIAAVAFVVAAAVVWVLDRGQHLPLGGPDSLGSRAAWVAAALAAAGFACAYLLPGGGASDPALAWRASLPSLKRIIDVIAFTAAIAMLAYLAVIAIAGIFQIGFRGLTVDPLGGAVLAGFAAAAVSYAAALFGSRVTAVSIAALAVSVLFVGTLASMISSPDESWWQYHFSQLGNTQGITGYRFNLALIITGLVITALAGYVGRALDLGLERRGVSVGALVRVLTWLFAGIGLCMMVVGLVPDAVNFAVHVGAASGMVVLFGAFAFGALRFVPGLPGELVMSTLVVVIGIVIAILLWVPIEYYNLTGMEFIAAGLLFAWLLVFVRSAEAYGAPVRAAHSAH